MKKILFFFFLTLAHISYCQVGIGNSAPRGALDINRPATGSTDTNNPVSTTFGLVLPVNNSTANMQNPQGGAIAPATMMFESSNDCIKYYRVSAWSNCLLTENGSQFSVSKVEQTPTFNGTYKSNVAMTASNTYVVGIKNDSPTAVTIALSTLDLKLSGINGLSVGSVSPTSLTIQPGATGLATYTLTGTTTDCGPLTGTWSKMKLTHTATTNVGANPTYQCNTASWNETVAPDDKLNGLTNGQSYTGTYTIPYTNGGQCPLPAETLTSQGLTVTYAGGDTGSSGQVSYTLSGTYTGPDGGSVSFTTAGGCVIYLGPLANCKEILQRFPGIPSGVYKIDPDKQGTTYNGMNAECDMTTDGGGWTLVLNYLHQAGTNPPTSIKTTLPVIGSSTLGTNEGGNATTWGHGNRALQAALNPTDYRFNARTSGHTRVIHFKTSHAGSVTYFTTGAGSASGIQSSFTALAGHTANLPASADAFYVPPTASNELLLAPFYRGGINNWDIDSTGGGRWEVDDYLVNSNTLHRVWVR